MSPTSISLPESLAFFYGDRANHSALTLIMDSPELPPDLGWDEVLAYHDAKLAAQKVRTDYCAFLHLVWERTWGATITRLLPESPPVTVGELGDWQPKLDAVWENAALHGIAKLPRDHTLWAAVTFSDGRTVGLAFWAEGNKGDFGLSDLLPLSDAWEEVDDDNTRRTAPHLCVVTGHAVDLSALADAARDAVELLVRKLTKPGSML